MAKKNTSLKDVNVEFQAVDNNVSDQDHDQDQPEEFKLDTSDKLKHYAPDFKTRIDYHEEAHNHGFGPSVVDKSAFVPLSVQVAEMLGKKEAGLGASSSVAIHSSKDFTFPDGIKGVESWKVSPLDDRFMDIAEVSELRRVLESERDKLVNDVTNQDKIELLDSVKDQIKAGHALDKDVLKEFGNFDKLIDGYNASIMSSEK